MTVDTASREQNNVDDILESSHNLFSTYPSIFAYLLASPLYRSNILSSKQTLTYSVSYRLYRHIDLYHIDLSYSDLSAVNRSISRGHIHIPLPTVTHRRVPWSGTSPASTGTACSSASSRTRPRFTIRGQDIDLAKDQLHLMVASGTTSGESVREKYPRGYSRIV